MPGHDIIVIGASAGGLEAIIQIVRGLPGNLPAAVLVVTHLAPHAPSLLSNILTRAGTLPAEQARHGQAIEPGHIYCAIPDHHLLVREGTLRLSRGPRENSHRPAIDPLFRSAAIHYAGRTIGVVLSGNLDDGTAGLRAIKSRGGLAVVQNPHEAAFPSMPLSAIENVDVDHVVRAGDMAALLIRLVDEPVGVLKPAPASEMMLLESRISDMDEEALASLERPGTPAPLSCPECHGTLFEIRDGKMVRYRCRIGHGFSAETLLSSQAEVVERALWNATVALREKAVGARRMMDFANARGHTLSALRFEQQARDAQLQAEQIQGLLQSRQDVNATLANEGGPEEAKSA